MAARPRVGDSEATDPMEPPPYHVPVTDTWLLVYGKPHAPDRDTAPAHGARQRTQLAKRSFASNLSQARIASQLTIEELAEYAGVSYATVCALEDGSIRFPDMATVSLLEAILGASLGRA